MSCDRDRNLIRYTEKEQLIQRVRIVLNQTRFQEIRLRKDTKQIMVQKFERPQQHPSLLAVAFWLRKSISLVQDLALRLLVYEVTDSLGFPSASPPTKSKNNPYARALNPAPRLGLFVQPPSPHPTDDLGFIVFGGGNSFSLPAHKSPRNACLCTDCWGLGRWWRWS